MTRFLILTALLILASCKSDKRYHDKQDPAKAEVAEETGSYKEEIMALRKEKDDTFAHSEESPLKAGDKSAFRALDYFVIDSGYRVEATLEPALTPEITTMPTTTNREVSQRVFGTLHFTIDGQNLALKVYQDQELMEQPGYEDYLFLPFTDLTNGESTYGGGRYMDLSVPQGNTIILDFNKAYNPYCAYNSKYSCPLVPVENHLGVAIRAGEKAFKPEAK